MATSAESPADLIRIGPRRHVVADRLEVRRIETQQRRVLGRNLRSEAEKRRPVGPKQSTWKDRKQYPMFRRSESAY